MSKKNYWISPSYLEEQKGEGSVSAESMETVNYEVRNETTYQLLAQFGSKQAAMSRTLTEPGTIAIEVVWKDGAEIERQEL